MKKLSNIETEVKKRVVYKKSVQCKRNFFREEKKNISVFSCKQPHMTFVTPFIKG